MIRTASGGERVVTYANGTYHSPDDGSLHYVLTMNDITEERATHHLLEHLLRSATTVAIVGTDRTGRITVVNAGAEALLRFDAHEATQHSFLDFLDPDELALRGVAAGVPVGLRGARARRDRGRVDGPATGPGCRRTACRSWSR